MVSLEEPDKGYAWVILTCAFIINLILSGMARMVALLYVELIDAYGVTRKAASVPFLLRNAIRYIGGPIAGVLGQTFGIRAVTFWGGLIAAVGSILCTFAPSLGWIVFFWGILHGLGYALSNTLFQVVINQYFEKHRATASGIVLSGACIAAFIFPLMIDAMIDNYGIFGCFLLLGGLFLNVCPFSLMLKSPSWVEFPKAYAKKRALILKLQSEEKCKKETLISAISQPAQNGGHFETMHHSKSVTDQCKAARGVTFKSDFNCNKPDIVCTLYQSLDVDEIFRRDKMSQNGIINPTFAPPERNEKRNLLKRQSSMVQMRVNMYSSMVKIPGLFLNPTYTLISFSVTTYFAVLLPVFTVLVDYARDKGIPREQEKLLIYSLTIGDLVGRVGFGWVTDRKYISYPNFMVLTHILQAVFTALLPASNSLVVNFIVVLLYGIVAGIIFTYFPVLVYRYVDKELLPIGIGSVGLMSSVSTFGIPPLIGYFRDHVGSYDGLFYTVASFSMITAGLWLLVSIHERRNTSKFQET